MNRIMQILALLLCWSAIGCSSNGAAPEEFSAGDTSLTVVDRERPLVNTFTAAAKPFRYVILCNGKVRPAKEIVWIATSTTRIRNFPEKRGQKYPSGAIIAQLDERSAVMKKERAELNRFNSGKEYESQLLQYEKLMEGKTDEEISQIKKKLRISSGLSFAEQDIKEAESEMQQSVIMAPFAGELADIQVQEGQYLKPGQEMFRLYSSDQLFLEVKALEADLHHLQTGLHASVLPVSPLAKAYPAVVEYINPYVDEDGMIRVRLRIQRQPHDKQKLFPGMNCKAEIFVPLRNGIVLPKEAVVIRNGKPVVFTLENGRAKWHTVKTGRENGEELEILDGIQQGQKVILTGNLQLTHDSPVSEAVQ